MTDTDGPSPDRRTATCTCGRPIVPAIGAHGYEWVHVYDHEPKPR